MNTTATSNGIEWVADEDNSNRIRSFCYNAAIVRVADDRFVACYVVGNIGDVKLGEYPTLEAAKESFDWSNGLPMHESDI